MSSTNNRYHVDDIASKIASQLIESISKSEDCLGIFLSGSAARGGNDQFSDIDINILTKNKARFFKKLPRLISQTTNVLFNFEPSFLNNFYVYYLGPGYKFDFEVYDLEDKFDQFTLDKTRIVADKNNVLAKKLKNRNKSKIPSNLADKYLGLALADIFAVAREVKRKDLLDARYNLDEARNCIVTYINLSNNSPYFHPHEFNKFIDIKMHNKMKNSLKNNDTYEGLINASKMLLEVIENLHIFSKESITMVNGKLTSLSK